MSDEQDELEGLANEQDVSNALEAFFAEAAKRIRVVSHKGEPWYSVVDVVGLLTDAPKPRNYWAMMKERLQDEGFRELLSKCRRFKLIAPDGKRRETDCADFATIVALVYTLPSLRRREKIPPSRRSAESAICGIYSIVNTYTNEQYIGSSYDIHIRYLQHKGLLRRGKHHARRLQEAWNLYGESAFELVVLEELTTSRQLEDREQQYLDDIRPVYNEVSIAKNQSTLSPISSVRIHQALLCLYDIQCTSTTAPLFRLLREAIIYGVIAPGPNFQRLLEAEASRIETWPAFNNFLQQQVS